MWRCILHATLKRRPHPGCWHSNAAHPKKSKTATRVKNRATARVAGRRTERRRTSFARVREEVVLRAE